MRFLFGFWRFGYRRWVFVAAGVLPRSWSAFLFGLAGRLFGSLLDLGFVASAGGWCGFRRMVDWRRFL